MLEDMYWEIKMRGDADEAEFLNDRMDHLEIQRISLITMLCENQKELVDNRKRLLELKERNNNCPEGCTCMKCEDK